MPENQNEFHPVQTHQSSRGGAKVTSKVTLAAYEVYCHVFAPQESLITGDCRGGFGTGELLAFLYARSFPKSEWSARFHEAIDGMKNL